MAGEGLQGSLGFYMQVVWPERQKGQVRVYGTGFPVMGKDAHCIKACTQNHGEESGPKGRSPEVTSEPHGATGVVRREHQSFQRSEKGKKSKQQNVGIEKGNGQN